MNAEIRLADSDFFHDDARTEGFFCHQTDTSDSFSQFETCPHCARLRHKYQREGEREKSPSFKPFFGMVCHQLGVL